MINIKCDLKSHILATRVDIDIFLPDARGYIDEVDDYKSYYSFEPFKTIFLMHGAWDRGVQWIENTSVLRLAEEKGFALVVPSVGNTFYANTLYGLRYEDYFMNELTGFVRGLFPLSERPEDNFLCGVSMGGYGALKAVFKKPEAFGGCAVMSSVVDISASARIIRALGVQSDMTLGHWRELKGSQFDLRSIIEENKGQYDKFPALLMIDSPGDYLNEYNRAFHEYLETARISHDYREYEGLHEWKFWDEHMKECIDFFAS